MMSITEKSILNDIYEKCEKMELRMSLFTEEEFYEDVTLQESISADLFDIGGLVTKLPDTLLEECKEIDWKKFVSFREVAIEGKERILLKDIWDMAVEVSKTVKNCCESFIK